MSATLVPINEDAVFRSHFFNRSFIIKVALIWLIPIRHERKGFVFRTYKDSFVVSHRFDERPVNKKVHRVNQINAQRIFLSPGEHDDA